MPRPSSSERERWTSPAFSIRVTVCVTRLRLWASASASAAIRICPSTLGEAHEDLVLDERDVVGPAQVLVQAVEEQGRADHQRSPGALLAVVEPPRLPGTRP